MMLTCLLSILAVTQAQKTVIDVKDDNFFFNNELTYSSAKDSNVHGLLMLSRLIQGVFDDANQSTIHLWQYPDTKKWDPMRNTQEFVGNMSIWRDHGLLSFTVGLQGGAPTKSEAQMYPGPWIVSAYDFETGELNMDYMNRLEMLLSKADEIGMIPIIQFFYVHQIGGFNGNNTIIRYAINNIISWLNSKSYANFLICVANECDHSGYGDAIVGEQYIASTMDYIHNISAKKYYIGTSFDGGAVPNDEIINASDIILLHGNGQNSQNLVNMYNKVRESSAYKANPKPILVTEDPGENFNSSTSNLAVSVANHVSWGFMDNCNSDDGNDYIDAYQCPPVSWSLNTATKQQFFDAVKSVTS